MFDRFKRNRPVDEPAGRTAVAERTDDDATTVRDRDGDGVPDDQERGRFARDDATAVRDRDGDGVPDDREHHGRGKAVAAGAAGAAAGAAVEHHHDRKVERREERAVARDERAQPRRHAPVMEADAMATMRERQRARYGGASWGAAFFGLLSAVGLAAILTSILTAAGAAIGLNEIKDAANAGNKTLSLGGAILLLVVLAVAWYCGGYVAGRMARFDGARQGFAVWIWTLLFVAVVALVAVIGGEKYDVAGQLNLPSIPTNDQTYATGGLIAAVAAAVVTLLFAVLGGKAGDLFHRRVDRIATDHYEEPVATA